MTFILSADIPQAADEWAALSAVHAKYRDYLACVREQLPASAYAFAVAPWHYDPTWHECPHDAWVESLLISEPAEGVRHELRGIEINLRLLGAYHDGYIELRYQAVRNYSLAAPLDFKHPRAAGGHGDWLIDEVRLSERGLVLHEIEFSHGGHWLIECADISYQWQPLA